MGTAFAVGFAIRALIGQLLPIGPSWDGVIYERAARQLANGDGYTLAMYDPGFRWAHLPTAFYPPGWPATLSLLKQLDGPLALDLLLQALLGALAIPLAARFAGTLAGHLAARRAAWLVALWPGGWMITASWMGEPLFGVALLLALLPLASPRGARPSRLGFAGALLGLAAYVRPTALAIAPFALLARRWCVRRPLRALLVTAAATVLAAAPLAPWVARNAEHLDGAVVASNGGANLYVGTLGPRYARIPQAIDCPRGARELARDRCRRERALGRIAADPLGWIELGAEKVLHTFGYEMGPALALGAGLGDARPEDRLDVRLLIGLDSVYWLALLAFALRGRARRAPSRVVWGSALGVALLHFVFLGGDRYHLPLVPLFAALAAAGLGRASGQMRSIGAQVETPAPTTR
ncbi:MAG: hypothetical protein R3B82_12280 [Sandaracinaceae bacterium]